MQWAERIMMSLSSNSPFSPYVTDLDGYLRWVNRAWEVAAALPHGSAIGKHLSEIVPQALADEYLNNNRQVAESHKALVVVEQADRPDGRHVFQSMKFPVFDDDGSIIAVAGVSIDITQQRQLEDEHSRCSSIRRVSKAFCWQRAN